MTELIFFNPIFKEMIWGGDNLKKEFGYNIPSDKTGEAWIISAHPQGESTVARGKFKGQNLSYLWATHPDIFGNYPGSHFPFLIKIIDACEDLSLQVHPDDNYANHFKKGAYGKTECWYVLNCQDNSEILIGHNAQTKEELERLVSKKSWDKFIRKLPIKKGDFFQINAGCVHAIKKGTLILETQQNSNITFRIYDYDRLQNGKKRELHTKEALDVITIPHVDTPLSQTTETLINATKTALYSCEYYNVEMYHTTGPFEITFNNHFTCVTIIDGKGTINGINISKGSCFIIPNKYGLCGFKGQLSFVCSYM